MKLLFATAATLLVTGAATAQDVVRLGTEGAYPPYNYLDDSGEVAGFERALGDELCARAELTCEWVTNDWDSIIPNLTSGNYDAIMAGMSITDARDEVIDFSDPYTPPATSSYVALSDDVDVEAGVIAAQTGTIQADHVSGTEATLLEFATPEDAVAAMRSGEADAVMADTAFLEPYIASEPDLMVVGDEVELDNGMGIGLRDGDEALQTQFNDAIQSMQEDGTLNELIAEWLPETPQF